jgi:hypothetical protein
MAGAEDRRWKIVVSFRLVSEGSGAGGAKIGLIGRIGLI